MASGIEEWAWWLIVGSAAQNVIPDDPHFSIDNFIMPDADLSRLEDLDAFLRKRAGGSQASSKLSQLSPGERSIASLSSGNHSVGFDFLGSSHSSQRFATPASAGREPLKPLNERLALLPDDEGLVPMDNDLGFMVDAEGNVIELGEPELPPLFGNDPIAPAILQQEQLGMEGQNLHGQQDEGLVVMGEQPLPDAEALDTQVHGSARPNGSGTPASQPARRRRRRKAANFLDQHATFLATTVIRGWGEHYVERAEAARVPSLAVMPSKAKSNAFNLTFGTGIANVGKDMGLPGMKHPLAEFFAGEALRDNVFRIPDIEVPRSSTPEGRRRRTAAEAFEEEDGERRVRRRSEDGLVFPDADPLVEMGRDDVQAADHHSSMMPWSRQGSNVPGSAVKPAQRSRSASVTSLLPKSTVVPDIERFSDPHLPSDNFLGGLPHSSSIGEGRSEVNVDDSQWLRAEVEGAARDFFAYAAKHARVGNVERGIGWVGFEELVVPGRDGKGAAAQGFYHVLSLATRGRVKVRQEVAFGEIVVGVEVGKTGDLGV